MGKKGADAHIAKQPVDVEYRASVRIPYARDDALGIGTQKRDGAHGGRRHECARGARVCAERRIEPPTAVRMRGEERVEDGGGVELGTSRKVEIIIERMKREG